jgi:hypothetical protein
LSPTGNTMPLCEIQPINERKLRPLAALEPEQQCEVWEEAVRSADGEGEPAGATAGGWPGVPGWVTMAGQGKGAGAVRCAPVVASVEAKATVTPRREPNSP